MFVASPPNHLYPVFFHVFQINPPSLFISAIMLATHVATSSLVDVLVVPWMTPSEIIHNSHVQCRRSLNGSLKPTSTGWQREANPPGMCFTSTPSSWILCTTNAIMWHW
jgi:hypothetical protein